MTFLIKFDEKKYQPSMSTSPVGIPTMTDNNGQKEWRLNGELHREDGPAIEKVNGDKEWYVNGKLHRNDGPAVEYSDKPLSEFSMEVLKEDGPSYEYVDSIFVSVNGYKAWYIEGERHRDDGPAVEYSYGNKEFYPFNYNAWYMNGQRHREDGPAYSDSEGDKEWYLCGELHCEDGPAIDYTDGDKSWYLNGERITEEEHSSRTILVKRAI
jgi:hypothetical protein